MTAVRVGAVAVGSSVMTIVLLAATALLTQHYWLPHAAAVIQSASPPTEDLDTTTAIIDVIEVVNPAVVSVVVTKDVPIYERYYETYNSWGFFGGVRVPRLRESGTEEREVGGGSGFIISADGLIITNRHVVDDTTARYSVLLNDGTSYETAVLVRDTELDIAVLQITNALTDPLPYLTFGDSETIRLGEPVIAIGNALAEFRNSVSVGVISGLGRTITASDGQGMIEELEQVIQTDAAINPGNSGGPLLNTAGEVIGVNVAVSVGAENIGFAIPSHLLQDMMSRTVLSTAE